MPSDYLDLSWVESLSAAPLFQSNRRFISPAPVSSTALKKRSTCVQSENAALGVIFPDPKESTAPLDSTTLKNVRSIMDRYCTQAVRNFGFTESKRCRVRTADNWEGMQVEGVGVKSGDAFLMRLFPSKTGSSLLLVAAGTKGHLHEADVDKFFESFRAGESTFDQSVRVKTKDLYDQIGKWQKP